MQSSTVINLRRLLLCGHHARRLGLTLWLRRAAWHAVALPPLAGVLTACSYSAWPRSAPATRLAVPGQRAVRQLLLDVGHSPHVLFQWRFEPIHSLLYLLPLAIARAALPASYVWGMAAVTTLSYTARLVWHVPTAAQLAGARRDFGMHVLGMWLGFVPERALIAWFA